MARISTKRFPVLAGMVLAGMALAGIAHEAFAQPAARPADRVLYDRAIEDIERGQYAMARLNLNTLVDTYATSDYPARAKLAIALSWLRQGDAKALDQAEAEYKDFVLFYPNMKEVAIRRWVSPCERFGSKKRSRLVRTAAATAAFHQARPCS